MQAFAGKLRSSEPCNTGQAQRPRYQIVPNHRKALTARGRVFSHFTQSPMKPNTSPRTLADLPALVESGCPSADRCFPSATACRRSSISQPNSTRSRRTSAESRYASRECARSSVERYPAAAESYLASEERCRASKGCQPASKQCYPDSDAACFQVDTTFVVFAADRNVLLPGPLGARIFQSAALIPLNTDPLKTDH